MKMRGSTYHAEVSGELCRNPFFFNVGVTHPNFPSHASKPQKTILKQNETIKKTQYKERVREIENASFTPVFSTNGATGEEATPFHKVLAEKLSEKTQSSYVKAITFIRKRISFTIIHTALIALRGKKY